MRIKRASTGDDPQAPKKARVDGSDGAAEAECCSSCGTPWNVPDQEEWLRDNFYTDFRNGDAAAVQRVREYWKENVHDWIDAVEDEECNDESHDAVPTSLREGVDIMMQDSSNLFYSEDCNNSANGTRCYRNRLQSVRAAVNNLWRTHETQEEENFKRAKRQREDEHSLGEIVWCNESSIMSWAVVTGIKRDDSAMSPFYELMWFDYDCMHVWIEWLYVTKTDRGFVTEDDPKGLPKPSDWEWIRRTGDIHRPPDDDE